MKEIKGAKKKNFILIIDDDEAHLKTLADIFDSEGIGSVCCSTGKQALEAVEKSELNVAILDLCLPDVDGIELLKQLKEHNQNIKVIVNTGNASLESAMTALNEEAFAYVKKMGNIEELLSHVHRAFHSHLAMYNDKLEQEVKKRTAELAQANKKLVVDISRRKETEAALRDRENLLHTTISATNEAIIAIKSDGLISIFNPSAEKIFGHKKSDMIGQPLDLLMSERFREDHHDNVKSFFMTGEPNGAIGEALVLQGLHSEGREFPMEISLSEANYGGSKLVIAVIRDITERKHAEESLKESEEKLRNITSSANDAIVMADENGNISFWNSAAEKIFGYDQAEVMGKDMATHIFSEDVALEMGNRLESLAEIGKDLYLGKTNELTARKKNGDHFLMELSLSALRVKGKWHAIGILRNITERKQLEEELQKASKIESVKVLAGGIAHDFNNLLTSIIGNTSLAMDILDPGDEVYEMLIDAEKAAQRAKDLTQQLLTFSKGGVPIKKLTFLEPLIKESIRFALIGSNVKCNSFISDNLLAVEIDEDQINQVLNNLIINADQAMPEGGLIKLKAENVNAESEFFLPQNEGKYVKISIQDKGAGIPEKHLQKIFDPYFTTKQRGSGFGLSTSFSIIRKHNGYLTVDSTQHEGTTFYIFLPVSPQNIELKKDNTEKQDESKGKVLVLDDEADVRKIVGKMLKRFGCEVEFAEDGAEAIESYKSAIKSQDPFDFIIMDLTIPGGMGGEEAIKKLREIDPDVTAIASSGYSKDPIVSNYSEYGFSDFLVKPYEMAELRKILKSVTENQLSK